MEKQLLISELDNASGYLNRILQVACRFSYLHRHPTLISETSDLYLELAALLNKEIFTLPFQEIDLKEVPIDQKIAPLIKLFENLLDLNMDTISLTVDAINSIYTHTQKLHQLVASIDRFEIEYPRINMISEISNEEGIPLFQLDHENVFNSIAQGLDQMISLKNKRSELYHDFLYQGHQALLHQEVEQAHEAFLKAQNLNETAEVITLIGWTFSLKDNLEEAKKCCLRAIRTDPDFGPPYNDIGTYLLKEGKSDEALKWFDRAKRATKYQNREYPYINSARAYISQKRFNKALEEFSFALTLTPYNDELQESVINIRNKLQARELPHEHH